MGKDAGAAPQAPNPLQIIPAQAAADKATFNYQTDANRYGTTGPDQTQSWAKSTNTDQASYDAALKAWQAQNPQGTWVPGDPGGASSGNGTDQNPLVQTPATQGHWEGGTTSPSSPAPQLSDYQTNSYNLNTTLAPGAQALHDATQGAQTSQAQIAQALLAKLGPGLGGAFDTSGAPALQSTINSPGSITSDPGISDALGKLSALDPTQYDKNAADAIYHQQTSYLDPQVQQEQKALEARLSEQGFVPGTPGYQQAMQNFQDTNNRAYSAARDSATTQGAAVGHTQFSDANSNLNNQIAAALQGAGFSNQAQQQGFQQANTQAAFGNTARAQSIAELLQGREVPLNDLSTLLSRIATPGGAAGVPATAAPQGGVGALQNPDQIGAYNQQYQDLLGQYNAGVSSNNNTTSTIGGLVGAIAIAF